jgi:BT1 family.
MDRPSSAQLSVVQAEDRRVINRLLVFFALVYVVEGVGQVEGLIAQPLSFYLKEVHGWTALEVSAYLTIFNFPWIIKPLYGAFSDFVPLLAIAASHTS